MPRVLAGGFYPQEIAFLVDVETGQTTYKQTYVEGVISGNWFEMPAGNLGFAFGLNWRRDQIVDRPGAEALRGNVWFEMAKGITRGANK
jgi:iron complex outermembrane recepter protein